MQEYDDETSLVERAVAGDPTAVETLLRSHQVRLLRYVERHLPPKLRSYVEPADVVQDTYFEAYRVIAGFRPTGTDSVFRWMATITKNKIIRLQQRHAARPLAQCEGIDEDAPVVRLLEQLAVYHRTPSQSAAAHELMRAVEDSLGRLPPDYRTVVSLRHIERLTVAETAVRMSRDPEAVYLLCCRALRALRLELGSRSRFA